VASRQTDTNRRARLILLGVAVLTPIAVVIFSLSPIGKRLERTLYDSWFNRRGELAVPEHIALVAIDLESEDSLGRYPWNRRRHASLIRNLARAGVKVVAFDATFADPFPADDPILMEAIRESGITILGAKTFATIRRQGVLVGLEEPTGDLREAPYGIVDIEPGQIDAVVREYPIVHYYHQGTYQVPQLGVQALKMYLGIPLQDTVAVTPRGWRLGDIEIPRGPGGNMLINYVGFRGKITTYSYASVVDDASTDIGDWDFDAFEDLLAEGHLEGKMVFVGSTIPEDQDQRPTVFRRTRGSAGAQLTPGVEIHANAVETILQQRFIWAVNPLVNILLIFLASVFATIVTIRFKAKLGGVAGIGMVLILMAAGYLLFRYASIWVEVVAPIIATVMAYSGSTVALYLAEQQEKARIRGMFQQYVAESVVDELIANPDLLALGGEERELTVLFCDVAEFTSISEGLTPTELVSLLNEYLTEMTEIVFNQGGIIDKYEGDAMMAEFGAPVPYEDHAWRGCMAALQMQRKLAEMRPLWESEGQPILHSRIGLNTGVMLIGNLGSRHVMDYTVMGDNVNLASRLEGANKAYGTNICISEMTYEQLHGEMICRELDMIRVKGKTEPVRIFEVLETTDIGVPAGFAGMLERYEFGLMLYRDRQFADALDIFNELCQMDPDDGPSRMNLVRCQEYLSNPPPDDWDGVFTMTTK
jgi:adenylate cyclase